jgi:hypothetical protein
VWLWIAVTAISLGLDDWASYHNIQVRLAAEKQNGSGVDVAALVMAFGTAALFIACLTLMTVSLLHRPAFPRPVDGSPAAAGPAGLSSPSA